MAEKTATETPSIRREFMGGSEEIGFAEFSRLVIQEGELALRVARAMLAGQDPYPWNEDVPEFAERFSVIDPDVLRESISSTVKVAVTSVFTRQRWEGEVKIDVPAEGSPQEKLDRLFRFFNRVDEADVVRLEEIGFRQPSMSMGDLVELDGETWTVAAFGFEIFGS